MSDRGCKAVIFVEFVPVTEDSKELAPGGCTLYERRADVERIMAESAK